VWGGRQSLGRIGLEAGRRTWQRDVLVIAQVRVGLGMALPVGYDRSLGIADGDLLPDGLLDRFRQRAELSSCGRSIGGRETGKAFEQFD